MITRSRSNNPAGTGGQSPDDNADVIRVNTPADVEALQEEIRQLREQLEASRRNMGTTPRRTRLSSPTPSDETSDASERSEAHGTASNTKANIPPLIREPKVGKPNKFSGKHSEFLSFMTQCEAIFKMCPSSYPNDEYKVLFIITNLDGSALRWAQDIFAKDDHPYRKDYQVFRNALFSLYDNHTYRQDAEDRLLSLKQTKSASTYAVEFQTLAAALKFNNDALCSMFFKGLKPTVKTAIMQQGRATTLDGLRDQAVRFDQHQHRMRVEEAKESKTTPRSQSGDKGTTQKPINEPRRRKFPLSTEEYERRKSNRLCFGCGEAGHSARNCKKKPRPDTADTAPKEHANNASNMTPFSPYSPVPRTHQPTPITPSNWQSQPHSRSESRDVRN